MYNIIQLNEKDLSELQSIAKELGIKKVDSMKKDELVYKILDEQAIVSASKKAAANKVKEGKKTEKQKKERIADKKENTTHTICLASMELDIHRKEKSFGSIKRIMTK